MSWNYRIGYRKKNDAYGIYSVYYEEDGRICATSVDPTFAEAESIEALRMDLALMLEAFDEPVIEISEDD